MILRIEIREVQYKERPCIVPSVHFDTEIEDTEFNVRVYKELGMQEADRLYELSVTLKKFITEYYQRKAFPNPIFSESDKRES